MKNLLAVVALLSAGALFADDAYIQSDGTQAITTDYYINAKTKIEIDFQMTAITSQARLFGQDGDAAGHRAVVYFGDTANNFKFGYGTTTFNGVYLAPNNLQRNTIVYDSPGNKGYLYQNGEQIASVNLTAAHNATANFPMAIFAQCGNAGGSSLGNCAKMKLYGFKIYEDGDLVHDYEPAAKGGVTGLVDTVTGTFLYGTRPGGGPFTGGGNILELEDDPYIENTGSGQINTRFFMAPDMKVEVDYALVGANATQVRVFGADNSGANFFSAYYINGSGNMSFGIGDAFVPWATTCATNLFRHRAVLDVAGIHAYYITRFVTNWTGNASAAYGMYETNITKTAKHPLAIFGTAKDENGLSFNNSCKAKIYGFKCWKAGNLVHDYVPCVKGGVPGFKDLVDGAFITAENPAALRAGGKGLICENDDGYISTYGNNVSTGARYLDTGYTPTANTRVEIDYALADNYPSSNFNGNHDWYLFDANGTVRLDAYLNKAGMGWSGCDKNWHGFGMSLQTTQKDVRRTVVVDNKGWAGIITAGFTNKSASATSATATYSSTLRLSGFSGGNGYGPLKIYGCKIYESGSLQRSYTPYVKDGIAGLLDTVGSGGFVSSAIATNALKIVAGGNIEGNSGFTDAYIEGDGTQAISTGVTAKPDVCYEVDYQFTRVQGQARVFGTAEGTTANAELYVQGSADGSGTVAFGHGATWGTSGSASIAAGDLKRRKGVFDLHTKQWTLGEFSGSLSDVTEGTSTYLIGLFAKGGNAAGTSFVQNPNFTPKYSHLRIYSFRIYEYVNGVKTLTHEFLPYKKGSVVGVYDTQTGEVKTNGIPSGNDLTICGMGVDGSERWIVRPQNTTLTKDDVSTTLSANASGAVRYRWTKNGTAIEGGTDGDLTVEWAKGGATDTYTVTPVYDVYGNETDGESISCTVFNHPLGMMILLR